ncbi:hypothetical protein JWG39_15150 [Desulforhopalus vacuolatus]|uniref:glycosyltransferase family 10 domain-containing protein n=1 Tax=Desulforhopalus vacuolatus TaxID=40414 RepID=UPI00196313DD|nr:glycosyltransferase family 10 [Desulforhopalus vacuolatus]MBM9521157.1 hypothetical protein [Desulforhopalus vacuolatus]
MGAAQEFAAQWGEAKIKVKFLHRGIEHGTPEETKLLLRQFPVSRPQWGDCYFDFDPNCSDYDWLVVYHDLPKHLHGEKRSQEHLACAKERTMLVTLEPSSITVYGTDYLRQYGSILTFQEPWAVRHPNVIFHHPGLTWYYGMPVEGANFRSWDEIYEMEVPEKTKLISTVCSDRSSGGTTIHAARTRFTWQFKDEMPELDIYGHGVNPMNDKADILDPYQYHIAVENHIYPRHLTEKLPDALLGFTLPFYYGAPDAAEIFPPESFVPVDITDYHRARDIIRSTIAAGEWRDRLPYIIEARRRVLEEENLFALLARYIDGQEKKIRGETMGCSICNRPTLRVKKPVAALRGGVEKAFIGGWHWWQQRH